jgi:hypothetical protein
LSVGRFALEKIHGRGLCTRLRGMKVSLHYLQRRKAGGKENRGTRKKVRQIERDNERADRRNGRRREEPEKMHSAFSVRDWKGDEARRAEDEGEERNPKKKIY